MGKPRFRSLSDRRWADCLPLAWSHAAWAAWAMVPLACAAAPHVAIDDSGTVVEWQAPPRWASERPSDTRVQTAARVRVALSTQAYAGKHMRIYMRMAPSASALRVAWSARPGLLPGALQPGGRALVFDGTVASGGTHGLLDVLVTAPGDAVLGRTTLRFTFEAEQVS